MGDGHQLLQKGDGFSLGTSMVHEGPESVFQSAQPTALPLVRSVGKYVAPVDYIYNAVIHAPVDAAYRILKYITRACKELNQIFL